MGDSFVAGPWTLGNKYKWMAPIAMLEVLVACVFFCMPFGPAGIPGNADSRGTTATCSTPPLSSARVILLVGIWWLVSARKWFKGPVSAFDLPDVEGAVAPAAP